MKAEKESLVNVEKHRALIEEAYLHIWKHPETGYREWKTHAYLAEKFEALGYSLQPAGNIPGFYTDLDTGRPGPTVAVFGELDSLIVPTNPEADPDTGYVHACGHCAQAAALLGLAAALKEPGALDALSGRIRLVAVPAEELIEQTFREDLRRQGVIRYFGGKPEFLYRGFLDGVDLSFMIHSTPSDIPHYGRVDGGCNGCNAKKFVFRGVSAHAGNNPHDGINALYAAQTALGAVNALRETFRDEDHVRAHFIITKGGSAMNAIPDEVVVEGAVRANNMDTICAVNDKVNRAMAAAAASMGCKLTIEDRPGYFPRTTDPLYAEVFRKAMEQVLDTVEFDLSAWWTACTDAGDISAVMPIMHPYIGGCCGTLHGTDFRICDVDTACVDMAKVEYAALTQLLGEDAAAARQIVENYHPIFPDNAAYFAYMDRLYQDVDAVTYQEDGSVLLTIREK